MSDPALVPARVSMFSLRAGAIAGLLGVGLGAFGAHGLSDMLEASGRLAVWETAVLYQLIHAVVLLAISPLPFRGVATSARLFTIGMLIFSGSLYILCLSGVTWLGAITPIGGVLVLLGWLRLIFTKN